MGSMKKTNEQFIREMNEIHNGEYILRDRYVGSRFKIVVEHSHCGKLTEVIPGLMLKKLMVFKCKHCAGEKIEIEKEKECNEFGKELYKLKNGQYKMLGNYYGKDMKTKFIHLTCEKTFISTPYDMLNIETECPNCDGDKKTASPQLNVKNINNMNYKYMLNSGNLSYNVDAKFMLKDLAINRRRDKEIFINKKGFKNSGVYIFKNKLNNEIIYVGTSVDIISRFCHHYYVGWGKGNLREKVEDLFPEYNEINIKNFMDNIIAEIVFEEDILSQLFLEKYLIYTLKPTFNLEGNLLRKKTINLEEKASAVKLLNR